MPKTQGSWSGMRKYLEQEMLSPDLQGRVRYDCTTYPGMDGDKVFRLFLDKREVKRFSHETVNSYFIHTGLTNVDQNTSGQSAYWDGYWEVLKQIPMTERTEYHDIEFCDALADYRNQPIEQSVRSNNPIVVMFALLDRRVGKRTLVALQESASFWPEWLQEIYTFRVNDLER